MITVPKGDVFLGTFLAGCLRQGVRLADAVDDTSTLSQPLARRAPFPSVCIGPFAPNLIASVFTSTSSADTCCICSWVAGATYMPRG